MCYDLPETNHAADDHSTDIFIVLLLDYKDIVINCLPISVIEMQK